MSTEFPPGRSPLHLGTFQQVGRLVDGAEGDLAVRGGLVNGHTVRAVRRAKVCVRRRDLDDFDHESGLPRALLPLQQAQGPARDVPEWVSLAAMRGACNPTGAAAVR